jgi:hypothetical protein
MRRVRATLGLCLLMAAARVLTPAAASASADDSGAPAASTDSSASAPSWQPQLGLSAYNGVECASTRLCLALDSIAPARRSSGEILASTDPAGGQLAWQTDGADRVGDITAISCLPETTTCVAVDNAGNVLTSG